MGKVRRLTKRARHRTLQDLLRRLNPVLRGWCNNWFRHGVSKRTFGYLDHYAHCARGRMVEETTPRTEHAHPGPSLPPRMGDQRRKDRNVPTQAVRSSALPIPGHPNSDTMGEHNHNSGMNTQRAGCSGSCTSASRGRAGETHQPKKLTGRPGPTPTPTSPTGAGFLYLAAVIDVWSRRVVGVVHAQRHGHAVGHRRPRPWPSPAGDPKG